MYATDGGHDPSQATHEKLKQIRTELGRHPAVTGVEGRPRDTLYTELRADIDPISLGADAPAGTLTVRWFVGNPSDPPRFTFHYVDESGFDCGWHHHEQDHVEGWGHYQRQAPDATEYTYEEFRFETREPSRVVWIVLEELRSVLHRK